MRPESAFFGELEEKLELLSLESFDDPEGGANLIVDTTFSDTHPSSLTLPYEDGKYTIFMVSLLALIMFHSK